MGYSKTRVEGARSCAIPKVSVPVLAAGVGGAADAAPSVAERREGYALATRSVRHADAGTADAEVLPACWRLMPCEAGVALSYAVEFEYVTLRANAPGLSDARLRRGRARRRMVPAACGVRVRMARRRFCYGRRARLGATSTSIASIRSFWLRSLQNALCGAGWPGQRRPVLSDRILLWAKAGDFELRLSARKCSRDRCGGRMGQQAHKARSMRSAR